MVKFVFALSFFVAQAFAVSGSEILARYDINASENFSDDAGFVDVARVSKILEKNGILDLSSDDKARQIILKFSYAQSLKMLLKPLNMVFKNLKFPNFKNLIFVNSKNADSVKISLCSNRLPDPSKIYTELKKHKIYVEDFGVSTDRIKFRLNFTKMSLCTDSEIKALKSNYFINIKNAKSTVVKNKNDTFWYQNVTFYDAKLDEISNQSDNAKIKEKQINFPANAHYMQLSDTFA